MLEKSDLQQIRTVVREEIEERTPTIVEGVVEKSLAPVKKDIKVLKSDVTKIRKNINTIIKFFDNEYLDLRKRVERIEEKIGLAA